MHTQVFMFTCHYYGTALISIICIKMLIEVAKLCVLIDVSVRVMLLNV